MARLTQSCTLCGKTLELIGELSLSETEILQSFRCGHSFIKHKTEKIVDFDFRAVDGSGKEAREYQIEGVRFILENDGSGLIADQMRLGKTPQSLLAVRAYNDKHPDAKLKTLILVKSANLFQWLKEYKVWASNLPLGVFMIQGSKNWIPPGFDAYLMSMDTISRKGMIESLKTLGINCLIIDECHSFKNPESKRSQALVQFIKDISTKELERVVDLSCVICRYNWKETSKINLEFRSDLTKTTHRHQTKCPQCGAVKVEITQHNLKDLEPREIPQTKLIMLSGTPIKNRADEYFIPLNLLAPQHFPSLMSFRRNYLIQNDKGQYTRIDPYMMDTFQEKIKPFVLRRERKDVWKQIPKVSRNFIDTIIEDEDLKKLYNAEIDKIMAKDSKKEVSLRDIQENLMTMRRIVGLSKVNFVVNLAESTLEDDDDQSKICIGIHHHAVRDLIKFKLSAWNPLVLSGEDSAEQKYRIVQEFNKPNRRVIIINQLAGGVGTNDLYCCSNIIMAERQWSSADEEQFEDRFQYIDKTDPINYDYILAKGTLVDEWWSAMVERKRQIFGETVQVNGSDLSTSEISDMVEFLKGHRL